LLGRSLYRSGQFRVGRMALEAALTLNPQHANELHRLLARAWVEDIQPNYQAALEHISLYLTDESLSSHDRDEGLLLQSQILFQLDDVDTCRRVLAQIEERSALRAEATIVEGRLLMREAARLEDQLDANRGDEGQEKIAELWQRAIQTLRTAQGADTLQHAT